MLCEWRLKISVALTSDLKLTVLFGAEHGVSQAEPRQLFAELRQEIVCNEAYGSSQDVQDKAERGLRVRSNENICINNFSTPVTENLLRKGTGGKQDGERSSV